MKNEHELKMDWVNLPIGCEARSLWECLHDCSVLSIKSDLLNQSVTIEIEAFFLPDNSRVFFQLDGVSSVRAGKFQKPYESLLKPEMIWNEKNEIAREWTDKWREESMDWSAFELLQTTDPFMILDADLASGKVGLTLRMDGYLNGETQDNLFCSLFVRTTSINVTRNDSPQYSLEQFISDGESWWEAFANKRKAAS